MEEQPYAKSPAGVNYRGRVWACTGMQEDICSLWGASVGIERASLKAVCAVGSRVDRELRGLVLFGLVVAGTVKPQ